MIDRLLEWFAYIPRTVKPEEHEERVDSIVARVDVLEERVGGLETVVADSIEARVGELEERVEVLENVATDPLDEST